MKDLSLKGWAFLEGQVFDENLRQLDKWGIQNHNAVEWYAITAEECGELAKAMLEYHFDGDRHAYEVVKEAIQTATLCLKIAEMFQAKCKTGIVDF